MRRDFSVDAAAVNTRWCGDITYLPTWEGWLYLATVIDIASRRVVGLALAEHLRTELVADALTNAVAARDPAPGVVFHADRGCQDTSGDYARLAEDLAVTLSSGRTGQCWDNALAAESFFASLKGECLDQRPWPTRAAGRRAILEYIAWYNGSRLHSALGYKPPAEFEEQDKIRKVAGKEHDMARINYDEQTAAAYKAVREVPRDGLSEWRKAVRRHLRPSQGMTLVDIGAGTGQFAAAFGDWFGLSVLAVEPSAAMRDQIPRTPAVQVLEGDASALPLPDASADAAWLSLVLHHIPDLGVAAHEIRRVLRPGAPVLIRQGFPGRLDRVELVRWFPETARTADTYPSVTDACKAFAAAGFGQDALEQVRETYPTSLADFLGQLDTFRHADTTMRSLTEDEFLRGKARLRRAVRHSEDTANPEPRSNWLDLLVLR